MKEKDLVSVMQRMKQDQLDEDVVLPRYQERLAMVEDIIRSEDIVSLPERPANIRVATPAEAAASPASHMSPPQLVNNTGQYGEFVLVTSNPALGEEARRRVAASIEESVATDYSDGAGYSVPVPVAHVVARPA